MEMNYDERVSTHRRHHLSYETNPSFYLGYASVCTTIAHARLHRLINLL